MAPNPSHPTIPRPPRAPLTFALVAGSSVLFCSKGVLVKLAFAEGADPLTVLALRMGFALPAFLAMALLGGRHAPPLTGSTHGRLAALGFLGYYVSAWINFTGLQFVSVGLERIILYTYPTLVLVISRFGLRQPVARPVWIACGGAWLGVLIAFAGEHHTASAAEQTALGAALIFLSALTYAGFLLLSSDTLHQLGELRFTGLTVGWSCGFVLLHYAVTHSLHTLGQLPAPVYVQGAALALFGTVAPALLMSYGLRRAGPQRFAIISTVGPVATLFLGWGVLGEQPSTGLCLGFGLTVLCGLAVARARRSPARPQPSAPAEASDPSLPRRFR